MEGLVDLALWTSDRAAVVKQVGDAARGTGFLTVINHGISEESLVAQFECSKTYFALPDEVKATTKFTSFNGGWEKEAQARSLRSQDGTSLFLRLFVQIRPSTGTADIKESFQVGFTADAQWPTDEDAPGFHATCAAFMKQCAAVSDVLLRALALALDLPETTFSAEHDTSRPDVQTVLRLLHYPPVQGRGDTGDRWRAGAHTDFDILTLLFQRVGQGGLEVCPGRLASTSFGAGDHWEPVPPVEAAITCNIGDMLMRWTDDEFKSNYHRVRAPPLGSPEAGKSRYSIAYFNQCCKSTRIAGKKGKYEPLTGAEFLKQAVEKNYAALLAKQAQVMAATA